MESAEQLYQLGIANFERGNYHESVSQLEEACNLSVLKTKQGGEIQIWLVNAYDAVGRYDEAIALCRTLTKHPSEDVRKSARFILGILTAPKLADLQDVTSTVSGLKRLDDNREKNRGQGGSAPQNSNYSETKTLGSEAPVKARDDTWLWGAIAIASLGLTTGIYLLTR
jgi:tetratricopeptide (TPR) repeat protein